MAPLPGGQPGGLAPVDPDATTRTGRGQSAYADRTLGPGEFIPFPFCGNLGAPQEANVRSSFGTSIHYMLHQMDADPPFVPRDVEIENLSWLIQAAIAIGDRVEIGLDAEVLQSSSNSENVEHLEFTEFGFRIAATPELGI